MLHCLSGRSLAVCLSPFSLSGSIDGAFDSLWLALLCFPMFLMPLLLHCLQKENGNVLDDLDKRFLAGARLLVFGLFSRVIVLCHLEGAAPIESQGPNGRGVQVAESRLNKTKKGINGLHSIETETKKETKCRDRWSEPEVRGKATERRSDTHTQRERCVSSLLSFYSFSFSLSLSRTR